MKNQNRKTTLGTDNRDLNPDLPVVHSLVKHESDALDHATTEAGGSSTLVPKKHHRSFDDTGQARHAFIFAIGPLPLAKRHTCPPIGRRYLPKFPERKGGGGKIHPSGLAKKNVAQDCWEEQKLRSAAMSSKFLLDSMLPKYHHQLYQHHQQQLLSSTPSATSAALFSDALPPPQASPRPGCTLTCQPPRRTTTTNSNRPSRRLPLERPPLPVVPGAFSSTSSAALAAAAAVDAAVTADKSCRYTAGLAAAANVPPPDSMVNYTLGHHHQNGTAVSAASSVSAASASMAAAAQFYHQAAAASAAADPLTSCSQPGSASAGQPIPDIPRYPWMSITGEWAPYSRHLGLG
ncbi:unnamed protein product [Timema podura]|uniref:Uncharacterized protein n=1 Tax=Timema podura TaxID=61482 RepID=A0ABN7NNK0_TIMPD|nr:unnamed protein product [Timema podura]